MDYFGRKLENGSIITARYIVTDGETGNGASILVSKVHLQRVMEHYLHHLIIYQLLLLKRF